ncbi:hypothetical protein NE686_00545 [Tissierella carlieri]|uniref:Uncharacterized protein n=1 Tax=Tissierella carlieri TaxID=689904 RepID=A0ABT1S659_9FIRM|nr:hypothetical protein [Tissierella carlieri]MCQ4921557.1 hypothetical protein [Tissierella carlieri]
MGSNLYYKKYIEKLIDSDPTNIVITRIEKISDEYKGYIEKPIEITETVTFYQKKSNRQTVNESGVVIGYMATSIEKILAKGNANILEGDTFKASGREYKVSFVNSYLDICKQIELEVIKNEL